MVAKRSSELDGKKKGHVKVAIPLQGLDFISFSSPLAPLTAWRHLLLNVCMPNYYKSAHAKQL